MHYKLAQTNFEPSDCADDEADCGISVCSASEKIGFTLQHQMTFGIITGFGARASKLQLFNRGRFYQAADTAV